MRTCYPLTERLAADYPRPSKLLYKAYPRDVRQARAVGIEFEDLDSLCWLGAMKAERRYDPSRGTSFKTYAVPWMRSEMTGAVRAKRAAKRATATTSMDAAAWPDGPTVGDLTAGPDVWAEYEREQEVAAVLRLAERHLPPSVRAAVLFSFGVGKRVNGDRLCKTLDVPGWVLSRMRKTGLDALRRHAGGAGGANGAATG